MPKGEVTALQRIPYEIPPPVGKFYRPCRVNRRRLSTCKLRFSKQLPLQRIFHPRWRRLHQAAQLRLQLTHLLLHFPSNFAIAEVPFHAGTQPRDVFGLCKIHLEEKTRPRRKRKQV